MQTLMFMMMMIDTLLYLQLHIIIISFPVTWCFAGGQWLNLHDGACFLINIIRQTNMAAKKAMLHRGRLLKIYSLIKKFVVLGRIFTFIVF